MRSNKNILGRRVMVRDTATGHAYLAAAIVVDSGVRLQSGEHFGEKRTRGQYEILEKLEPHQQEAAVIAAVWTD